MKVQIQLYNRQRTYSADAYRASLEAVCQEALDMSALASEEAVRAATVVLAVTLVSPKAIRELNREQRGQSRVTDVLSFPMLDLDEGRLRSALTDADFEYDGPDGSGASAGEGPEPIGTLLFLGDIVICPARAAEQAEAFGHSMEREMAFLCLHACLHLLGYDHVQEAQELRMRAAQRRILEKLGLGRDGGAAGVSENSETIADTAAGRAVDSAATVGAAPFHSGFICLVGRPNAGKSTLLNALCGQRLAITSKTAQTTRETLRFIRTDARSQMIFVDTPGLHTPRNKLGGEMMRSARSAIQDSDLVLFLIDALKGDFNAKERQLLAELSAEGKPVFALLTKIDLLEKERLLPLIARLSELPFRDWIPISAAKGEGLDELLNAIYAELPEGPLYFDAEDYTDQSERHLAAELIREKVLRNTYEEVPHACAVLIQTFREAETEGRRRVRIDADLICERESHKKILLGRDGSMLKRITAEARVDIEELLDANVTLSIFVKVRRDWQNSLGILKELGYGGVQGDAGRD